MVAAVNETIVGTEASTKLVEFFGTPWTLLSSVFSFGSVSTSLSLTRVGDTGADCRGEEDSDATNEGISLPTVDDTGVSTEIVNTARRIWWFCVLVPFSMATTEFVGGGKGEYGGGTGPRSSVGDVRIRNESDVSELVSESM